MRTTIRFHSVGILSDTKRESPRQSRLYSTKCLNTPSLKRQPRMEVSLAWPY